MDNSGKHAYAGYLLTAVLILVAAVAVYPHDFTLYQVLRTFSHRVGKAHAVQEVLNLFRCFGKGDVVLLILAGLGFAGARRQALHILLALLIMTALIWPFKLVVARERPGFTNTHSFPSGDAATAAAFCVPLMTATPWTAPLAVAITGGVAAGRVYDGRHYPSDVMAGLAFGLIAGAIASAIMRRWRFKPPRKWYLAGGLAILIFALLNLSWANATPFVLDFLSVWGPLGLFLLILRLLPAWRRLKRPRPVIRPVLLFALLFVLYLTLTTASSLWDRDEPRFSRATVEMVESGNYLYPTFNGQLRPDKPILIYWLMSIPVRVLGPSELACRLVAPIATLLAALMTFWIARRLRPAPASGGNAGALCAGLVLMLSPLMVASGTAATTDALLLACITGAISSFLLSRFNGFRLWHVVLMMTALSGALLTKGPVGLAVPLLVITAMLTLDRNSPIRRLSYLGWLLFAATGAVILFLSWGLPANAATHGEFLRLGIGKHVVNRSLNAMESHGGRSFAFYFYYLPVIILAFFPWTLYLPRIVTATSGGASRRLMLCWAIPVLVLMSLVATKLPHYILPAWPALALATALGIQQACRENQSGNRTLPAKIGAVLFLLMGSVLGLGLIIAPWLLPVFGLRTAATATDLLVLVMTASAWHYYRQARHGIVTVLLATGMILLLLATGLFLLPSLERYKLSPLVATTIQEMSTPDVPVATCGYGEPSLNFYLGRGPITPIEGPDLPAWANAPGKGILVATQAKLHEFDRGFSRLRIQTLDIIPGFNYSQGKKVKLHILYRKEAP